MSKKKKKYTIDKTYEKSNTNTNRVVYEIWENKKISH